MLPGGASATVVLLLMFDLQFWTFNSLYDEEQQFENVGFVLL